MKNGKKKKLSFVKTEIYCFPEHLDGKELGRIRGGTLDTQGETDVPIFCAPDPGDG